LSIKSGSVIVALQLKKADLGNGLPSAPKRACGERLATLSNKPETIAYKRKVLLRVVVA
jgi:hypothetical protein